MNKHSTAQHSTAQMVRVEIHIPKQFDGKAALYRAFDKLKGRMKNTIYNLYEDAPGDAPIIRGAKLDDLPTEIKVHLTDEEDDFDDWEDLDDDDFEEDDDEDDDDIPY